MATCNEYITPVQIEDFCNGCKTDVKCVVSTDAYTLLGLSANETLDVILNAMVVAINAQNTLNIAQNVAIEALENGGQPHKVYRALLSQEASADPTSLVLENTIGENIIWKRSTTGGYTAEIASGFDVAKTFYKSNGFASVNVQLFSFINTFNNKIVLITRDILTNLPVDNNLNNTPIEILVYE